MGWVLLVGIAAIVLIVIGIAINGLGYLLTTGLVVILLTLIIGAANYLRTGWRR